MGFFHFPLSRILLYFITGILFFDLYDAGAVMLISISAILLIALSIISKAWFEPVLASLALTLGMLTVSLHRIQPESHYLNFISGNEDLIRVTVREKLRPSKNAMRYIVTVDQVNRSSTTGKLLLSISGKRDLVVGSVLLTKTKVSQFNVPPNPGSFDYGNYLKNKSIAGRSYTKEDHCLLIGLRKSIWHYADKLRNRILNNLKGHIPTRELSVAAALILGQQQDIDREIMENYQYAGAVHILSVSGLHVGFIVLFLNFALARLPKNHRWKIVKLLITLCCLWAFAMIAGMSPSVIRSAVMFSFVAYGQFLRRNTNIYQTLASSALVILIADPSLWHDIGFQLSYAALFFIVSIQPAVAEKLEISNRLGRFFTDIVSVSIAAQIGTAPLTLYYFHQFPGLFLLTNIIVIPMLTVLMAAGVLVMAWAAFSEPAKAACELLTILIRLLNNIIERISSFESMVLTDIPFSLPMAISAMAIAVSIAILVRERKMRNLYALLAAILIFQVTTLIEMHQSKRRHEFIVFNQKKSTLIAARSGNQLNVSGNPTFEDKTINAYLMNCFAIKIQDDSRQLQFFNGKKILVVDSSFQKIPAIATDILVLTGSPKINLERHLKIEKPVQIVADGSNFKSYVERWERTCQKQKIPFHYTNEKGFFRLAE